MLQTVKTCRNAIGNHLGPTVVFPLGWRLVWKLPVEGTMVAGFSIHFNIKPRAKGESQGKFALALN
jgi:hypothetical protein